MKKNEPIPMRDYFHATGAELREWATTDAAAKAEQDRRAAKRAAKKAAAVAA